jgi:hypothetical protein
VSNTFFIKIWNEFFPQVKLRKYLRFTKCCFCVKWRAVQWDVKKPKAEKHNAMVLLREHYRKIKLERSYARWKANEAILQPQEALSMAMDGCENLPHGVPHFPEVSKADDGVRLKYHCVVGIVHGAPKTYVFVGRENIFHDPNLTIEVLQRILKSEEARRHGKLPKTLYLQLDNCVRENKNTALAVYLSWLVERGVFDMIYVSYLPVGHTHNECDQLASRLGVGVRCQACRTLDAFVQVLRGCIYPEPNVVVLSSVANTVGMMNPHSTPRWTGSLAKYFEGMLGLEEAFAAEPANESEDNSEDDSEDESEAPTEAPIESPVEAQDWNKARLPKRHTTTLHFKFSRGFNNVGTQVPIVTHKSKHDDDLWSEAFYPFKNFPSGLALENIPDMKRKPLADERMKELVRSLNASALRVNAKQHDANLAELAVLKEVDPRPFHWQDGGRFLCEIEGHHQADVDDIEDDEYDSDDAPLSLGAPRTDDNDDEESDSDDDTPLSNRVSVPMPPQSAMGTAHNIRGRRRLRNQGLPQIDTNIIIDNFVVFFCNEDPNSTVKRKFGIGKVVQIYSGKKKIKVKWWNSTSPTHFNNWRDYRGRDMFKEILTKHVIICRAHRDLFNSKTRDRGFSLRRGIRHAVEAGVFRVEDMLEEEPLCEEELAFEEIGVELPT